TEVHIPVLVKEILRLQQDLVDIQKIPGDFPQYHLKSPQEYLKILPGDLISLIQRLEGNLPTDVIVIEAAAIQPSSLHRQKSFRLPCPKHLHLIIFLIYSRFFNRYLSFHL